LDCELEKWQWFSKIRFRRYAVYCGYNYCYCVKIDNISDVDTNKVEAYRLSK